MYVLCLQIQLIWYALLLSTAFLDATGRFLTCLGYWSAMIKRITLWRLDVTVASSNSPTTDQLAHSATHLLTAASFLKVLYGVISLIREVKYKSKQFTRKRLAKTATHAALKLSKTSAPQKSKLKEQLIRSRDLHESLIPVCSFTEKRVLFYYLNFLINKAPSVVTNFNSFYVAESRRNREYEMIKSNDKAHTTDGFHTIPLKLNFVELLSSTNRLIAPQSNIVIVGVKFTGEIFVHSIIVGRWLVGKTVRLSKSLGVSSRRGKAYWCLLECIVFAQSHLNHRSQCLRFRPNSRVTWGVTADPNSLVFLTYSWSDVDSLC